MEQRRIGDQFAVLAIGVQRAAVAGGEHGVFQAGDTGGADGDDLAGQRQRLAVGIEAHAAAGLQAVDFVLLDVGVHLPAAGVDEDAQRLAAADPLPGLPVRRQVLPDSGERRLQVQPRHLRARGPRLFLLHPQLLPGGDLFGQPGRVGHQSGQARLVAADAGLGAAHLQGDVRFVEHHQPLAGLYPAGRVDALQQRRIGREHAELLLRPRHADGGHLGAPGQGEQQQEQRQHAPEQPSTAARDVGAGVQPIAQFAQHRQGDEPGDFHGEQEDSQQLEEEQVDRHGDAEEQHQAVDPGGDGEADQQAPALGRLFLRPALPQTEQAAADGDPGERRGAFVQVGEVEQVGEDEVAVEAHERAGVQRQRQHPAGGRQVEQGVAQGARIAQCPAEGGEAGQRQFGEDAGGGDRQALPRAAQLPAFSGVGVEHRPHHHEGDAHVRHAQPEPSGDQRVAEFVEGLRHRQGEGEAEQALGGEGLDHVVAEGVPLVQDEDDAEHAERHHQHREERPEQPVQAARQAAEEALRAHQRDAEEQVVVQPPAPAQPGVALVALAQAVGRFRAGAQQLVAVEEGAELQHLFGLRLERGLRADLLADAPGRLAPAQQAFELQPADAVEAVEHAVLDHPYRFAAGAGRGLAEAQVLAQRRQRHVEAVVHHQPVQARRLASGRRSR
ncbi:hypothetical protein D9M70_109790 [compost metagenome]